MCRVSSDSLRRISLQGLRTYGVLFFLAGSVFHTLCYSFAASKALSVVDHVIGFRRLTSKNGYVLVMIPQVTRVKILLRQFLQLMSQRWYVVLKTKIVPSSTNNLWTHLQHRDQWGHLMLLPGNSLDPRVLHPSGRTEAPLPLPKRRCNFFTRSSFFLNVWSCRIPVERSCRATRMWSPLAKTGTPRE